MIFHASVPADDPKKVAEVIAEIWGGQAFRFPPWPGAYVAMAGDERGSTVEVYPRAMTMAPGEGDQPTYPLVDESPSRYVAFHIAIQTAKTQDEILGIAKREGWRALRCSRGDTFDVIEFWFENRLHVEVLTQEMQNDYKKNVNYALWEWTKEPQAEANT